jgi:GMP synthase-like glutamine amidotransferase
MVMIERTDPLRIAVLQADSFVPVVETKYGGYGGLYRDRLETAAKSMNMTTSSLKVTGYDVVDKMEYPDLSGIDAIIVSGSKNNAFEDQEWIVKLVAFVKECIEDERIKVLGICFGHQIIGRALGATVARSDAGWEVSVCKVKATKKGEELFGKSELVGMNPQGARMQG